MACSFNDDLGKGWVLYAPEIQAPEQAIQEYIRWIQIGTSVAIIEDDRGLLVEARRGRKLVDRMRVGHDRDRLADAVVGATAAAMPRYWK